LIAQAERAAEVSSPGFPGEERIRAGFDDASIDMFGAEDAAQTWRGLVESVFDEDALVPAEFLESEGGSEAGDASAENGDASQLYSSTARVEYALSNSTARLMPCPGTNP
jgi:hypothetical protein